MVFSTNSRSPLERQRWEIFDRFLFWKAEKSHCTYSCFLFSFSFFLIVTTVNHIGKSLLINSIQRRFSSWPFLSSVHCSRRAISSFDLCEVAFILINDCFSSSKKIQREKEQKTVCVVLFTFFFLLSFFLSFSFFFFFGFSCFRSLSDLSLPSGWTCFCVFLADQTRWINLRLRTSFSLSLVLSE